MPRRVSSPILVGRTEEMAHLSAAYERVLAGSPTTVLVAGEAGIGKSRLLSEFVGVVAGADGQPLTGGCIDMGEEGLPFAPFAEVFRHLATDRSREELDRLLGTGRADLARMIPTLALAGVASAAGRDAAAQARLFEHVLGLLGRLAEERPLALVIEDMHWAEHSTRDLFSFLTRTLRRERVLLVGTYRSDDLHRRHPLMPLLSELGRLPHVELLELGRLDRDETVDRLSGILGTSPEPAFADRLFVRSDGNPFFLEELVAAGGSGDGRSLPGTIREIVGVRIGRLPQESQAFARIAAVIGREAEHEVIATVAGVAPDDLVAPARRIVDEQLMVVVDMPGRSSYAFRHALVQEAIYEAILPAERTTLHAVTARTLEDRVGSGREPQPSQAEIAHHWYLARDNQKALAASLRAADEASGLAAFAEVHGQLERVLELWPSVPDASALALMDRAAVAQLAADAAAAAGEFARAIDLGHQVVTELASQGEVERRLDASHRLAWYQWDQGDGVGAEATIRDALSVVGDVPVVTRARIVSDLAQVHWSASRYADQADASREALAMSMATDSTVEQARARMMLGVAETTLGRVTAGIALLEQSLAMLDGGPEDLRSMAAIEMSFALNIAGRSAECVEFGYAEVERLRAGGLFRRYGAHVLGDLADALIVLGRWDEAWAILDDPAWLSDESRASAWIFEDFAELASLRGDMELARTAIAAARDRVSHSHAAVDHSWFHRAEGLVARADGRSEEASDAFWKAIGRSPDPVHDLSLAYWALQPAVSTEADLAESARARKVPGSLGASLERGRRLLVIAQEIADRTDADWPAAAVFASHTRAERSRLEGESDPEAWAANVAALRTAGPIHDLAMARFREAEALLTGGGDRDRAREAIREAHVIAVGLGARPTVERTTALARRARLELTDGTSGEPTPERRVDPYGLSKRELEVLGLVGLGQTNREIGEALFISEKTASVHVTHILNKLGVASRVEAALLASRAGFVESH